MRIAFVFIISIISFVSSGQTTCNSTGNLAIYSNYDGGILTINADQNIANPKIGFCSYEPVQVALTEPIGGKLHVLYAGFNSFITDI